MLQSRCNAMNMEVVEQALFGLVLLDKPSGSPKSNQRLIEEAFCGDATRLWFDKSFSAIVFSDACVAYHYEHTYADAPVPGLGRPACPSTSLLLSIPVGCRLQPCS